MNPLILPRGRKFNKVTFRNKANDAANVNWTWTRIRGV